MGGGGGGGPSDGAGTSRPSGDNRVTPAYVRTKRLVKRNVGVSLSELDGPEVVFEGGV